MDNSEIQKVGKETIGIVGLDHLVQITATLLVNEEAQEAYDSYQESNANGAHSAYQKTVCIASGSC